MKRREALRATALVAARASLEAHIAMVEAASVVDAAWQRQVDTRPSAYRAALAQARVRAARA